MDAGVVGASDENCLNLNIFRPKAYFDSDSQDGKEGTKKLLPVLIYIHGGHFNGGSGRDGQISHLVTRAYTPIIGVTFNYRVGAFGFLAGKIAMAEGQGGGVNAGLKDQYCAIQWVVDNIEAFGGDPRNITVLGTSAGAHSVSQLFFRAPMTASCIFSLLVRYGFDFLQSSKQYVWIQSCIENKA